MLVGLTQKPATNTKVSWPVGLNPEACHTHKGQLACRTYPETCHKHKGQLACRTYPEACHKHKGQLACRRDTTTMSPRRSTIGDRPLIDHAGAIWHCCADADKAETRMVASHPASSRKRPLMEIFNLEKKKVGVSVMSILILNNCVLLKGRFGSVVKYSGCNRRVTFCSIRKSTIIIIIFFLQWPTNIIFWPDTCMYYD